MNLPLYIGGDAFSESAEAGIGVVGRTRPFPRPRHNQTGPLDASHSETHFGRRLPAQGGVGGGFGKAQHARPGAFGSRRPRRLQQRNRRVRAVIVGQPVERRISAFLLNPGPAVVRATIACRR